MRYAILADFTGPSSAMASVYDWCPSMAGIERSGVRHLELEPSETEEGDHEYTYLASENGTIPYDLDSLVYAYNNAPDPDKCRASMERRFGHDAIFWLLLYNLRFDGIVEEDDLISFLSDIGAYPSGTLTMGTLGGHANPIGIAPDIDILLESQQIIATIRVTPMDCETRQEWKDCESRLVDALGGRVTE